MPRAAGLFCLLLAGCSTNSVDTARQLMQQQAQEQAQARQQVDEEERKRISRPEVELSMIRKAQENGRYFASLAYLAAFRQQYGDTPESVALRAEAQRKTGQDDASAQTYRSLLNGPQAALGWHGLGLLAGEHGDYAKAADDLGRAARLQPINAEYLGDWGYALLRAGDIKAARVPLGQAAELDPDNQRILGNLAVFLLVEGDTAQADQVMERSRLSDKARAQVRDLAGTVKAAMALHVVPAHGPSASAAHPSAGGAAAAVPATPVVAADAPDGIVPMPAFFGGLTSRYSAGGSASK